VGQTINLGSAQEISINDLAHEVAMAVGRPGAAVTHEISRPGDVLRLYADAGKARKLMGFQPQVGFQEGLARLRDWYLSLGQSPEELLQAEVVRSWEHQEGGAHGRA
jgi:nucleoside-diphosphate-sugar epimerase